MVDIPTSVFEIDSAWLSDALERSVQVDRVEQIAVGEGFVGQLGRLHLGDGSTLIAKMPTTDPGGRFIGEMLRLWEREGRFYREVAPALSIRVARTHVNLADDEAKRYLLVMEDLAPARAADQVVGATPAQARQVVEYIGRFHAQWWEHPMLEQLTWMPRIDDPTTKMVTPMFLQGWAQFEERFRDVLPRRTLEWVQAFGPSCADFLDLYADDPVTIIHGDFRLDNMLFDADGEVTLVDWQMATLAPGFSDIVYFVGTNLEPDVRAAHLEGLLDLYVDTLAAGGVPVPTGDELHDALRKGILMWMVAMAGGIGQLDPANERGVALFDKIITRLFTTGDAIDAGAFLPGWLAQWKG